MKEQISNAIGTIGTPLLVLVLVFSLVATPVAGATTSVDFGADDGATITIDEGDTIDYSAPMVSVGTADSFEWDLDGDGSVDSTVAPGGHSPPSMTYNSAGTYTATHKHLSEGHSETTVVDSYSVTIVVESDNTAPVIDSGLDPATNITATVNESVSFDAGNSSDADNDSLTYSWDFDADGVEDSANASADTSFSAAGSYTVNLTVSDGTDSVTESYTVVVEEASEEPVGGGSADDGISTDTIFAVLGTFVFVVVVGVALRRIA